MGGGTRHLSFKRGLASCMHALLCVIPMAAHSHNDTAADEVLSVNEDDEDAFQQVTRFQVSKCDCISQHINHKVIGHCFE